MFYHVSALALGSPHRYPAHQKAILYPAYKFMMKPTVCKAFGAVSLQRGKLWGPCEPRGAVPTTVVSTITATTVPANQEVTTQIKSNEASGFEQTIRDNVLALIGVFPSLFCGELSAGYIFFPKRQFLKALKYNVL